MSTDLTAVSGLNYRVLVLDELITSLQHLAEGVAAYIASPDNDLVLPALKDHVGDISKTLSLIEIKGGAMLSTELEDLMSDVEAQNTRSLEDTAVVMVKAVEQLEEYLSYIKTGSADIPFVLLPLLNDIRAVRNAPLLSEAVMLIPDFVNSGAVAEGELSRREEKAFRAQIKLARAPFMKCLLKWYRGNDLEASFTEIGEILAKLQKKSTRTDVARLWKVARAVVHSLLDGGLRPTAAHKMLFGQIERFLQHLMNRKNLAIYQAAPNELFKNLLYYVALSESQHKLVQQLKSGYQLEDILPPPESRDHAIHALEGPSLKMLEAAGDEVRSELAYVKTTVEAFAHADEPDTESLKDLPFRLEKISRTLQMLGMDRALQSCTDVLAKVNSICVEPEHAKPELLGIAESILRVESGLGEYIYSREPLKLHGHDAAPVPSEPAVDHQADKLLHSVLTESMRTLERVKEQWLDAREGVTPCAQQSSIVHLLTETSGVLQILPMPELALLFRDLATYANGLDAELIPTLPLEIHNNYADVVANLEVYIELHLQGQPVMTDLLARSADALDALESHQLVQLTQEPPSETSDNILPQGTTKTSHAEVSDKNQPTDSKMLGVFIEEAMDQFNTISDGMIALRLDVHDEAAQKIIRRAYHTLKGSGRMVGVSQLSEFAWANENLLNKIIDIDAEPNEKVMQQLEQSLAALPQLVDALHGASEQVEGIDELNTAAFGLAESFNSTDPLFANKPKTLSDIEKADSTSVTSEPDSDAKSLTDETLEKTQLTEAADLDSTAPDLMELTQTLDVTGLVEASKTLRLPTMEQAETIELEDSADPNSHGLFEPIETVVEPVITRLTDTLDSSFEGTGTDSSEAVDPILFDIFSKECAQHIKTLQGVFGSSTEIVPNERMVRTFHTLNGSAQTARIDTVARLLGPVEQAVKLKLRSGDKFSEGETLYLTEVIQAVELKLQAISEDQPETDFVVGVEARLSEFTERVLNETEAQNRPVQLGELQSVFIEEAEDIVESLQELILRWRGNTRSRNIGMDVQSLLHTLKGSARVASYAGIADLAHAMEDAVQRWSDEDGDIDVEVLDVLKDANDAIGINLEQAKAGDAPGYFDWLINELRSIRADIRVDASGQDAKQNEAAVNSYADGAALASPVEEDLSAAPLSPDRIRLNNDILERLTDMVNESSVHHSQLMQHQSKMSESLGELDHTISRLRQQLRELDIESEIHISAENKPKFAKNFDALELDQYGKVQEISRAILESFSDLDDIRYSMGVNLRSSEIDMTEQARINGVVQETLGQVRMVRFSSIETRLRKVVSDAGRACAKAVNLKFEGDENAIDRSVLKHITTPLEHLLRNAVAHGIESSEQRGKIDKAIVGTIHVRLVLDEGDILLDISDDGRGVEVEKVRERAVNEGLIGAASSLNDQILLDLLMKPGFSTAESLSQISGRGVGLEAVRRELSKIGGALTMQSKSGQGTTFRIRIPQAQFVNQVLLLSAADQVVAIAANRVQGVSRITEKERQRFSANQALRVEFQEHACRMVSLNSLLGLPEDSFVDSASLVFVSAAGEVIALLVKDVPGHQEAIVKPVGRQVAALGVYSGACVQSDGTVAPVLDLSAVIAKHYTSDTRNTNVLLESEEAVAPVKRISVLVVDDSITMRKYVERALLRENYQPILARNGVEAMGLLRLQLPDIILTDLEMPQMDGFELVSMIKDNAELKGIPIVVISSRSGQKHRKKLAKAGVNGFLGKPYQEAELLDLLASLNPG